MTKKKRNETGGLIVPLSKLETEGTTTIFTDITVDRSKATNQTSTSAEVPPSTHNIVGLDIAQTTTKVSQQKKDERQTTTEERKRGEGQESDQEYDASRPRPIRIKAIIIHEPKNN